VSGPSAVVMCDPYHCIAKRNRKYSSECTEVHLTNLGAEELSESFHEFPNLETLWLSGNRLSRLDNLQSNFRIQELYLQDNRIVSLASVKTFKFLRVLLASNNQLRNLDKQLLVLTRFAFLKKLDLFDNPVAEEPDYRLRIIHHVPQVETLDRHVVKGHERLRADEVVPNLDKASAPKPEKLRKTPPWAQHSEVEKHCFRTARAIADRRRADEEAAIGQILTRSIDLSVAPPLSRTIHETRSRWEETNRLRPDDHGWVHSNPGDVLKALAHGLEARRDPPRKPEPFAKTLRRHLSGPAAKMRGDVFHQSFLHTQREPDELGRHSVRVKHGTRLTGLGG